MNLVNDIALNVCQLLIKRFLKSVLFQRCFICILRTYDLIHCNRGIYNWVCDRRKGYYWEPQIKTVIENGLQMGGGVKIHIEDISQWWNGISGWYKCPPFFKIVTVVIAAAWMKEIENNPFTVIKLCILRLLHFRHNMGDSLAHFWTIPPAPHHILPAPSSIPPAYLTKPPPTTRLDHF